MIVGAQNRMSHKIVMKREVDEALNSRRKQKSEGAIFEHPSFYLIDDDILARKNTSPRKFIEEEEKASLIDAISSYFRSWLLSVGYSQLFPTDPQLKKQCIYGSPNWSQCKRLLVIISSPSYKFGVWSFTLCVERGVKSGTMYNFIHRSMVEGMGILVVQPKRSKTGFGVKSAQQMLAACWRQASCEISSQNVSIVAYLDAAILAKEIIYEDLSKAKENRQVKSLVLLEGTETVHPATDTQEAMDFFLERAINWVGATSPAGTLLPRGEEILYCKCISVGLQPTRHMTAAYTIEVSMASVFRYLRFNALALDDPTMALSGLSTSFLQQECQRSAMSNQADAKQTSTNGFGMDPQGPENKPSSQEGNEVIAEGDSSKSDPGTLLTPEAKETEVQRVDQNGLIEKNMKSPSCSIETSPRKQRSQDQKLKKDQNDMGGSLYTMKKWLGLGSLKVSTDINCKPASQPSSPRASPRASPRSIGNSIRNLFGGSASPKRGSESLEDQSTTVDMEVVGPEDFEFLRVVGKGAFGKVMLVQKKGGKSANQVYAMKVLRKSLIAEKGQIEHTKIEFRIFCAIRHPFICRLRFAFQNDEKLYLVTDYYCGGSLFYHLRKAQRFPEERVRFYMAEILLAIEYLHKNKIIYRDLKLENVIMAKTGHIAITDFGLSKMHCEHASTFCGTAEYMAPELVRGKKYAGAVDWWSFGIMVFEMLCGQTPFYDRNRKAMFQKIMRASPDFPSYFSSAACSVIRKFLVINPSARLGMGGEGPDAIKHHRFFRSIDFEALYNKQITPPYTPDIQENEVKFVPRTYLEMEARDSADSSAKKHSVHKNEFQEYHYEGTPVSPTERKRIIAC